MTEAICLEIIERVETTHKAKHRVSVSRMLKRLGGFRSGYHAWLKRAPSNTEKRREAVKVKIQDIYDELKQNYDIPKITKDSDFSSELKNILDEQFNPNSNRGSQYISKEYEIYTIVD